MEPAPIPTDLPPELDPEQRQLRHELLSPTYFVESVLGTAFWSKQREIAIALRDHDEVAVRSCHAIGKSFTGARLALWFLFAHIDSIVWTTAPTARQVYNILWREIRAAHALSDNPLGGELLKTRLEINDLWYAYGFATDAGEQFQGLHSKSGYILGIVDEASGVEDSILEAAQGTLTSQYAKLLMLGNPNKRTGYFADSFKRPGVAKIKISAYDTPNFIVNGIKNADDLLHFAETPGIDNAVIVAPHLITPKFALRVLERFGRHSINFQVRIEAEFPSQDVDTLISLDLIEGALGREVTVAEEDEEVISCDPARFGTDRSGILRRKGPKILEKRSLTKRDNIEVGNELISMKKAHPRALVKIEINGMPGVFDHVKHWARDNFPQWEDDIIAVNVSEKAVDHETYANLRTELWANVGEWLKTGSLPLEDADDFREGADVKYRFTSKGLMMLEPKEDMKKRAGRSPDIMDSLAISLSGKHKLDEPRIRILG
jgi:hypothetical protein